MKEKDKKPGKKADAKKQTSEEPIVDAGVALTITTVPIVKLVHHKDLVLPKLPSLPDQIQRSTIPLIEEKIELCKKLCEFCDPNVDKEAKAIKEATLRELDSVFSDIENVRQLTATTIDKLFDMFSINIMRDILPVPEKYMIYDDEPPVVEVGWSHYSIVYQIMLNYQRHSPQDRHFNKNFANQMMTRLNSPDINEREQIVQFFSMYVKINPNEIKSYIKRFSFFLNAYLEDKNIPFAVTPILKFYIEQFPLFIKDASFLMYMLSTSIIQLVSAQHIVTFLPLITQLFNFYISIDKSITIKIVRRVMSYWPETCPSKQPLFINLLLSLISNLSLKDFELISRPLFNLLARCATSSSAKVVESSFQIWSDGKIIPMILDNTRTIFPIIFPAFSVAIKEHWNTTTQNAALDTLKSMHDIDPFIFDELKMNKRVVNNQRDSVSSAHRNWALIARTAAKTDREVNLARTLADIQLQFNNPHIDKNGKRSSSQLIHK